MALPPAALTAAEEKFLARQIRNVTNYLYFSIVGVVVALGYLGYTLWGDEPFDGTKFALVIVLLLSARGNLKQHKDARLLIKLREAEAPHAA